MKQPTPKQPTPKQPTPKQPTRGAKATNDLSNARQARARVSPPSVAPRVVEARVVEARVVEARAAMAAQRRTAVIGEVAPLEARFRSVGPPTVQRVLSPTSTSKADWDNLVSGTTGQGVNGVVIVTNAANETIVVKGMPEPPHRVMLAQALMERAGVATVNSNPVDASSRFGRHILARLTRLGNLLTGQGDPQGAAIVAKAQAWAGYETLLLMDRADQKNLSQLATTGPGLPPPAVPGGPVGGWVAAVPQMPAAVQQHTAYWQGLLGNLQLWGSFGKIFYIDQFLGNEDRFETLKIQNVFIDSQTGDAIAMDNDTLAADFISSVTETDAVTNPNNPQQQLVTKTADQYIANVIGGGMVYNPALQSRMMASLDQIAGDNAQLRTKVDQKVTALLNLLHNAVHQGATPNDQGATAALAPLLVGNNSAPLAAAMVTGANAARNLIRAMFQTNVKANTFHSLFKQQRKRYGAVPATETMFNYLALAIRHSYLEARSGQHGGAQTHPVALLAVQNQYRADVQAMQKQASTDLEVLPSGLTRNRLVRIR